MSDIDRPAVSRPLLIGLGSIVVVAVLWFAVITPLFLGNDDEDFTVPPRGVQNPPEVSGTPTPEPGDLYPETTEVFAARDPFAQLVSNKPAGTAPGTVAPDGTGSGTGSGSGSGSGSGTGSGSGSGSGSSAQVGGTEIKLVDVYTDDEGGERAVVLVNGRSYDVAEGESFADRFRLLDLSGECGTFLFGDSRFVLCEGDEIRK